MRHVEAEQRFVQANYDAQAAAAIKRFERQRESIKNLI